MAKTLQERLVSAQALVTSLQAKINAEAILNNVEDGNVVVFGFGRGEKRRELQGTVVAVKDDEKQGKLARIMVGEGFDAQPYTVRVADITRNITAEEAAPASEDGEPTEGTDGDPLANA